MLYLVMLTMSLINKRIYMRILEKKKRLDKFHPLPQDLVDDIRKKLMINYIYNSDALEGSSLSLSETRNFIEELLP